MDLPQKKKVLIVDDDEDDFFITSEYIHQIPKKNFIVDWSYNYADALDKLTKNEYDIYFIDYRLGIKSGMDLIIEANQNGCETPIILLTGNGNREIDMKAMESGVYDYLIKSELNAEKIERCIRYSLDRATSFHAVKSNERKYRSIFEKAKDVVFITDEGFSIIDINYAATELFGYEIEEFLNADLSLVFKKKNLQPYLLNILEESGEFFDYEIDLISKSGEEKNCIISASIEINNYGQNYIQGIIHDNTGRKRAEKTLFQAEKLAAAGRLVRTLAHEVRNPLNNINLSVEQLKALELKEETTLYLDILQRNSKRIGDLISELLNSSRLSTQINLIKTSVQEVVDNAIAAAVDRLTLKRIDLQVSYPNTPCYALIDGEKVQIALLNILINAIEAMEEGQGILKIVVAYLNAELKIEITDNGQGISDENLQRLFEPYFTSKRNGLGLGLASSLNIIQSNNGSIDVRSEVNKGSTFMITFKAVV